MLSKNLLISEAYKIMHEIKGAHFKTLKAPVFLKITTSHKFCKLFAAMWTLKEYEGYPVHEIKLAYVLALDKDYLTETITHELVHAEQWESGKIDTPHDRAFFSRLDYVLVQLGLPVTGKEHREAIKQY